MVRRGLGRKAALAFAVMLFWATRAAATEPYGTYTETSRNYAVKVAISGYSVASTKVSGTNESMSISAISLIPADPPYTGNDAWTSCTFNHLTLDFGGTGQGTSWGSFPWAHGIKWSTTHFDNGSLTITVTANVTFSRTGESSTIDVPTSVSVEIYNYGLLLGTKEKFENGQYSVDTNSAPALIAAATLPYAKSGMESMNHDVEPSVSAALNLRQSDLVDLFKRNTAFFTVTHGEASPAGIRASSADFMPWQGTSDPTSVAAMCKNSRSVPKYNLAVLITCTGLPNGSWGNTSTAFDINYFPPSTDRCVIGFTGAVDTCEHNETAIPQWTDKLYDYLAGGYTLEKSEWKVHFEDYIYVHPVGSPNAIRPGFAGDKTMKLFGVYGSPEGDTPCFTVTS